MYISGVSFDLCTFCTFLNSAQLASWAKLKNVQNLHKSKVTPYKQTPLVLLISFTLFLSVKKETSQRKSIVLIGVPLDFHSLPSQREYHVNLAQVWLFHLELPFAFQSCK